MGPVLSKLKQHAKIGVVTNMDTDLFKASRLPVELDDAVTSEMAGAYKPNPAIFDLALKRFGVAPAAACTTANKGERQIVQYQADYIFWKPA